jgi:hypothetical protein
MGLVSNFAVIGGIATVVVYAAARLLALVIVLRGTTPDQRAELVRAVAELFHQRQRSRGRIVADPRRQHRSPEQDGQQT